MRSYLVKMSVDFGQTSKFLIRPGDILVFDSQNQSKVTVYRNGEIVKTLPNQSQSGLTGLEKSGWIAEIHADAPKQGHGASKQAPKANGKGGGGGQRTNGGQTAGTTPASLKPPPKRVPGSTV